VTPSSLKWCSLSAPTPTLKDILVQLACTSLRKKVQLAPLFPKSVKKSCSLTLFSQKRVQSLALFEKKGAATPYFRMSLEVGHRP